MDARDKKQRKEIEVLNKFIIQEKADFNLKLEEKQKNLDMKKRDYDDLFVHFNTQKKELIENKQFHKELLDIIIDYRRIIESYKKEFGKSENKSMNILEETLFNKNIKGSKRLMDLK